MNPVVVLVSDVDVVRGIGGDALWTGELAVAGAQASPLGGERARGVELLDPVGLAVDDVHVARGVGGDALLAEELAVPSAHGSPLGDECAQGRELLDPAIARVGRIDAAGGVGGHPVRKGELAIENAKAPPLLVELNRGGRRRGQDRQKGDRCKGREQCSSRPHSPCPTWPDRSCLSSGPSIGHLVTGRKREVAKTPWSHDSLTRLGQQRIGRLR